jgi:hypothetical protein
MKRETKKNIYRGNNKSKGRYLAHAKDLRLKNEKKGGPPQGIRSKHQLLYSLVRV